MVRFLVSVRRSEVRSGGPGAFRIFALLSLCVLLGCAQAQLELQSEALNRASGATISEQVLLNAVRASLDLPMSFTKLVNYKTENMAKGSFAPKVPFGPNAVANYDLGPTVSWSSGVNQIEYVDVNTAGALGKLNQSLQYDAIDRYVSEGMPAILVNTIFVQSVEIHWKLAAEVKNQAAGKCPPHSVDENCLELDRIHAACKKNVNWREQPLWYDQPLAELEGRHKFYFVGNHAQTKCDFLAFQSLGLMLRLSRYGADLVPGEPAMVIAETPEKRLVAVPKEVRPSQGIRFQEKRVQGEYEKLEGTLKKKKGTAHRRPLKLTLRSPRAVLAYLGELIALQNFSRDPFLPYVMVPSGRTFQPVTVFRVIRGNPGLQPAALAVTGPHGDSYFVPHPEYGSRERDQTLRVLAIAAEMVNGAISEKDFPPPTSITVRAIQ